MLYIIQCRRSRDSMFQEIYHPLSVSQNFRSNILVISSSLQYLTFWSGPILVNSSGDGFPGSSQSIKTVKSRWSYNSSKISTYYRRALPVTSFTASVLSLLSQAIISRSLHKAFRVRLCLNLINKSQKSGTLWYVSSMNARYIWGSVSSSLEG
jgi:hypothetical protein